MIIFGNRAHYSAIGGVENSLRSLLKAVSDRQARALMVCREPVANEPLGATLMDLPMGIELMTYSDEYLINPLRRLLWLHQGGESLPPIYRELFSRYPNAPVVVRHHMHVLAARKAGFKDIRYLVPSLIANQLREELIGASLINRCKIIAHMLIDGWLQTRALRLAKLYVFSLSMKRQIRQKLPKQGDTRPVTMVLPGIDLARFKPASAEEKGMLRQRLNLPATGKLFLFVGRFVQAKGLNYLLDAMATMPSDCTLILVGAGNFESAMCYQVGSLGLGDRVFFVGTSSCPEDYYRACDSFVMSSTYEPLGQTILEAAACGIEIVAFSKQAGVDTATQDLGLDRSVHYADNLTANSLGDAMVGSIAKSIPHPPQVPSEKESEKRRQFAEPDYSWQTLLDQLTE
jgi:1,2-diacylglycerol 3-alpha-glucosyltransferase